MLDVKAQNITDSSAKLSWSVDEMLACYKICEYNKASGNLEEYAQTTKNNINVNNLEASTDYSFCVLDNSTNELLGATNFKTANKKPVIKVKERTSKKVVLSLGSHSKNEKVEIYRKSGNSAYKKIGSVTGKSTYTDSKVKGNTIYYYKARVITKDTKSAFSSAVKARTLLSMGLPAVSGKTKTFAYYTAVTAKSSPQYKLLNSKKCTTDPKTGIRMYDGCYCVALGSYYGTKIGTKYRITFSNGNSINVILCDQKANRHTDSKHQYAVNNKDIVEFYVQKSKLPKAIRGRGNFGILSQFSGSVVSIEKYMD